MIKDDCLLDWNAAERQIIQWKKEKELIVFTNGCFDIIHAGHIHYLEEAAFLGSKLIIGLNSDNSVQLLKGETRPINDQDSRAKVLAALRMVDLVVVFDELDPGKLIDLLLPDILVKGGDWKTEEIIGADTVLANGGEVKSLSFLEGFSTSKIIDKLKDEN